MKSKADISNTISRKKSSKGTLTAVKPLTSETAASSATSGKTPRKILTAPLNPIDNVVLTKPRPGGFSEIEYELSPMDFSARRVDRKQNHRVATLLSVYSSGKITNASSFEDVVAELSNAFEYKEPSTSSAFLMMALTNVLASPMALSSILNGTGPDLVNILMDVSSKLGQRFDPHSLYLTSKILGELDEKGLKRLRDSVYKIKVCVCKLNVEGKNIRFGPDPDRETISVTDHDRAQCHFVRNWIRNSTVRSPDGLAEHNYVKDHCLTLLRESGKILLKKTVVNNVASVMTYLRDHYHAESSQIPGFDLVDEYGVSPSGSNPWFSHVTKYDFGEVVYAFFSMPLSVHLISQANVLYFIDFIENFASHMDQVVEEIGHPLSECKIQLDFPEPSNRVILNSTGPYMNIFQMISSIRNMQVVPRFANYTSESLVYPYYSPRFLDGGINSGAVQHVRDPRLFNSVRSAMLKGICTTNSVMAFLNRLQKNYKNHHNSVRSRSQVTDFPKLNQDDSPSIRMIVNRSLKECEMFYELRRDIPMYMKNFYECAFYCYMSGFMGCVPPESELRTEEEQSETYGFAEMDEEGCFLTCPYWYMQLHESIQSLFKTRILPANKMLYDRALIAYNVTRPPRIRSGMIVCFLLDGGKEIRKKIDRDYDDLESLDRPSGCLRVSVEGEYRFKKLEVIGVHDPATWPISCFSRFKACSIQQIQSMIGSSNFEFLERIGMIRYEEGELQMRQQTVKFNSPNYSSKSGFPEPKMTKLEALPFVIDRTSKAYNLITDFTPDVKMYHRVIATTFPEIDFVALFPKLEVYDREVDPERTVRSEVNKMRTSMATPMDSEHLLSDELPGFFDEPVGALDRVEEVQIEDQEEYLNAFKERQIKKTRGIYVNSFLSSYIPNILFSIGRTLSSKLLDLKDDRHFSLYRKMLNLKGFTPIAECANTIVCRIQRKGEFDVPFECESEMRSEVQRLIEKASTSVKRVYNGGEGRTTVIFNDLGLQMGLYEMEEYNGLELVEEIKIKTKNFSIGLEVARDIYLNLIHRLIAHSGDIRPVQFERIFQLSVEGFQPKASGIHGELAERIFTSAMYEITGCSMVFSDNIFKVLRVVEEGLEYLTYKDNTFRITPYRRYFVSMDLATSEANCTSQESLFALNMTLAQLGLHPDHVNVYVRQLTCFIIALSQSSVSNGIGVINDTMFLIPYLQSGSPLTGEVNTLKSALFSLTYDALCANRYGYAGVLDLELIDQASVMAGCMVTIECMQEIGEFTQPFLAQNGYHRMDLLGYGMVRDDSFVIGQRFDREFNYYFILDEDRMAKSIAYYKSQPKHSEGRYTPEDDPELARTQAGRYISMMLNGLFYWDEEMCMQLCKSIIRDPGDIVQSLSQAIIDESNASYSTSEHIVAPIKDPLAISSQIENYRNFLKMNPDKEKHEAKLNECAGKLFIIIKQMVTVRSYGSVDLDDVQKSLMAKQFGEAIHEASGGGDSFVNDVILSCEKALSKEIKSVIGLNIGGTGINLQFAKAQTLAVKLTNELVKSVMKDGQLDESLKFLIPDLKIGREGQVISAKRPLTNDETDSKARIDSALRRTLDWFERDFSGNEKKKTVYATFLAYIIEVIFMTLPGILISNYSGEPEVLAKPRLASLSDINLFRQSGHKASISCVGIMREAVANSLAVEAMKILDNKARENMMSWDIGVKKTVKVPPLSEREVNKIDLVRIPAGELGVDLSEESVEQASGRPFLVDSLAPDFTVVEMLSNLYIDISNKNKMYDLCVMAISSGYIKNKTKRFDVIKQVGRFLNEQARFLVNGPLNSLSLNHVRGFLGNRFVMGDESGLIIQALSDCGKVVGLLNQRDIAPVKIISQLLALSGVQLEKRKTREGHQIDNLTLCLLSLQPFALNVEHGRVSVNHQFNVDKPINFFPLDGSKLGKIRDSFMRNGQLPSELQTELIGDVHAISREDIVSSARLVTTVAWMSSLLVRNLLVVPDSQSAFLYKTAKGAAPCLMTPVSAWVLYGAVMRMDPKELGGIERFDENGSFETTEYEMEDVVSIPVASKKSLSRSQVEDLKAKFKEQKNKLKDEAGDSSVPLKISGGSKGKKNRKIVEEAEELEPERRSKRDKAKSRGLFLSEGNKK